MFSPLDSDRLTRLLRIDPVRDAELEARPRRAAAFILLYERDQTRMLFLQKKVTPGYPWSGQIGMVGGFIEDDDGDDLSAAYRELEEEIQIPPSDVLCLGELGYFPTQITVVSLHVFVGLWNGEREPKPDPVEIDHLIEVKPSALMEAHEREGYAGGDVDTIGVRRLVYPTGSGNIWGVTARVLFAFNEMVRNGRQP